LQEGRKGECGVTYTGHIEEKGKRRRTFPKKESAFSEAKNNSVWAEVVRKARGKRAGE